MLDFLVKVVAITRHLEPSPDRREQLCAEILLWPEIRTFGNRAKRIFREHLQLATDLLREMDPAEVHERQIPTIPETGTINLIIHPLLRSSAWREPVDLTFPFVVWQHDGSSIAYLPDLELEVVSEPGADLAQRLEDEVRTALLRCRQNKSLLALAMMQRTKLLDMRVIPLDLAPDTPRERFDKSSAEPGGEGVSELAKVGVLLKPAEMPVAWGREQIVEDLARALTGRRAGSVLLVGLPGVGKSAIFHELVRRSGELGLEGRHFWKTSGSRLVSGMSGFGDWQGRCQNIADEAKKSGAILHLGNLAELLEAGRGGGKSDNVAAFFRPKMVREELLAVIECTPDQLAAVEKRDPRALDGLRPFRVEEPSPEASRRILREVAADLAKREPDEAALERVDSLHRRYAGYSAYPGKPVRFLQRSLRPASGRLGTGAAPFTVNRVNEIFSAESGLPLTLLEDSIPLDPEQTEVWLRERVMGQDEALRVVVDTIATIKARLSRPGKPLASLLFVGPTGVGKTELAKSLAEFFYGSRDRMIRLDMSEYNTSLGAARLVSDFGQEQEGLLTAQMRDQPFSVVLLDEFEKAHPAVFDLFLQVLGEARLTDGAGRVADFSNALVIMTSNLGAQEYRAGSRLGFGGGTASPTAAAEHFTAEAKKRFRPEFFNRIDHIVPFAPLSPEHLRLIVSKELESLRRRDGIRERRLRLELEPELVERILERGYDPRYGARPLRRAIGTEVLRRVAGNLNESTRERGEVRVGLQGVRYIKPSAAPAEGTASELESVAKLRRKFQRLLRAPFVGELTGTFLRLQKDVRRGSPWWPEGHAEKKLERSKKIDALLKGLEKKAGAVLLREETLLLQQGGHGSADGRRGGVTEADYEQLLLSLYAASEQYPELFVLVFQADELSHLVSVVEDYRELAGKLGCDCRLAVCVRNPPARFVNETGDMVQPQLVEPGSPVPRDREVLALALEFSGPLAYLWFRGEIGGHEFEAERAFGKNKFRVVITDHKNALEQLWLKREEVHGGAARDVPIHRRYNLERGHWKDDSSGTSGQGYFSADLLETIVRQCLPKEVAQLR